MVVDKITVRAYNTHDMADGKKEILRAAGDLLKKGPRFLKKRGDNIDPELRQRLYDDLETLRKKIKTREGQKDVDKLVTHLEAEFGRLFGYRRKSSLRENIEGMLWAVVIALLIRAFIIEAYEIPTGSMIPSLLVGDHLFVSKFDYGIRVPFTNLYLITYAKPKRGDVIVFHYPGHDEDRGKDFIKRVVAVAGQRVRLRHNVLYINGKPVKTRLLKTAQSCRDSDAEGCLCDLQEEDLKDDKYVTQHFSQVSYNPCQNRGDWPPGNDYIVPANSVFVMGDNRDNSKDSRYWGIVPLHNIEGKARIVFWPPSRMFHVVR